MSNDSRTPSIRALVDSLQPVLEDGLDNRVEFFLEYLDAVRFSDPAHQSRLAAFLHDKYAAARFDLIFVGGPEAFRFLAEHRDWGFLSAPAVYMGVRAATLERLPALPDSTGVISKFDLQATVRLAQLLQPDLRNLYVVTGAAAFDRSWDRVAREELAPLDGALSISFISGRALADVLEELKALPRRSAILYLSMFEDGSGQPFIPADVAERIAAGANAPVYSVYSTYMERGIVGGYMDTFEAVGAAAGKLGLRILQGEELASLRPENAETQTYIASWPAIQRWNLDVANLPGEAVLMYRDRSIWDLYREQILILVSLLLLQTLLIVALLTQGRRRRQAEISLRDSEDRMSLAARSANLGLWRWDRGTDQVWMTDHCREMLGLPDAGVSRLDEFLEAVHPDDRASVRMQIESSLESDLPFEAEHRLVLPDQSVFWVNTKGRSTAAPRAQSQVTGVVIDVAERKQAQLEAEQQRQQLTHLTRVAILGELSGALAHELNQPLAAILSNAQAAQQILRREPVDLEEIRAIMDDIVADDARAGQVIHRLRSLLKRDDTRFERLDVNELASEVLELAHGELITNQVSLVTNLAPHLPRVRGDRVQLQQVLLNLVVNACEAMRDVSSADRVLTMLTKGCSRHGIEILVSDAGHGVPPEILEQLFEPFFTTKAKGLGLGLSISRAIVAAHNGDIRAFNNDGAGATFSVLLRTDA